MNRGDLTEIGEALGVCRIKATLHRLLALASLHCSGCHVVFGVAKILESQKEVER